MNKITHILPFLFLLITSCAHKYSSSSLFSETMLPDGKTWDVKAKIDCATLSVEKCKERLRDTITKYGVELCGHAPDRVFSCAVKGNADYTANGSCYVKCSN